jgi:hypothetical protein
MAPFTIAKRMEQVIRAYIEACNNADAAAISACFRPDAVHYAPGVPKGSRDRRLLCKKGCRHGSVVDG